MGCEFVRVVDFKLVDICRCHTSLFLTEAGVSQGEQQVTGIRAIFRNKVCGEL